MIPEESFSEDFEALDVLRLTWPLVETAKGLDKRLCLVGKVTVGVFREEQVVVTVLVKIMVVRSLAGFVVDTASIADELELGRGL